MLLTGSRMKQLYATLGLCWLIGCSASPKPPESHHVAQPHAALSVPTPAPVAPRTENASRAEPSAPPPAAPAGTPCGELGCLEFEDARAALAYVLRERPRVLALGEAHAQKGSESVPSAAQRLGKELLPLFAGAASDLVIELLITNGSCGRVEKEVAERQKPVTQHQAAQDQNEYIELGTRAKALAITPHALTPSCEEYQRITQAGAGDIDEMLTTIARRTSLTVKALLAKSPAPAAREQLILTFGGALHNDLQPRPGREGWSFGPELQVASRGNFVALDLIVPEYVKDTPSWRGFPWYSSYVKLGGQHKTLLYAEAPHAYTLIFQRLTQ